MKAKQLFYQKLIQEDESIVEMKVWQVAKSNSYPLGVRYSLFWVKDGRVLLGYDNHAPKGPHRHKGDQETSYDFVSVEQLLTDFKTDMRRLRS